MTTKRAQPNHISLRADKKEVFRLLPIKIFPMGAFGCTSFSIYYDYIIIHGRNHHFLRGGEGGYEAMTKNTRDKFNFYILSQYLENGDSTSNVNSLRVKTPRL